MSYLSRVTGMIPIALPIPVVDLANSEFLPHSDTGRATGSTAVMFLVKEIREPVKNGVFVRDAVIGIRPVSTDRIVAYDLADELSAIAELVLEHGSQCDTTAYITRWGADQGDVERYGYLVPERTDGGPTTQTCRTEKAVLRWPSDGTRVEL